VYDDYDSPDGDVVDVKVKMSSVEINYYPPTINQLIRILRDKELEDKVDFQKLAEEKFKDKMFYITSSIKENTEIILNPQVSTCNNFPEAKIKVFV
jgi:hypothetical protein